MLSVSRRQSGLTLFEVLVVIVLSSMIVSLLVQAIGFSIGAFERTKGFQQKYQKEALSLNWFRASLENMAAAHDSEFSFVGDNSVIQGYTMKPVFGAPGSLMKIKWTLRDEGEYQSLWYEEGNGPTLLIAKWPVEGASFRYGLSNGRWRGEWPLGNIPVGAIPDLIELRLEDALPDLRRNVLITRKVRQIPKLDYRDLI